MRIQRRREPSELLSPAGQTGPDEREPEPRASLAPYGCAPGARPPNARLVVACSSVDQPSTAALPVLADLRDLNQRVADGVCLLIELLGLARRTSLAPCSPPQS